MITLGWSIFKVFCWARAIFDRDFIYDNLQFTVIFMALVKCPQCGKEVEFAGNEFRPFCSERCKLIDFGSWADEEFAIPSETESLSDEEIDLIAKATEGRSE